MTSDDTGAADIAGESGFSVRPVSDEQWSIVAWLWQAYRHDLAVIVSGLPYADGRYQAALVDESPTVDAAAYLAWRAHPKTGEDAPIGFALIKGLSGVRRSIEGFWVAPVARRDGVGTRIALEVLSRHEGSWRIAFQHDNIGAGIFWRRVADAAFGPGEWTEETRPVPMLPNVPPDHFIESN